MNAHQRRVFMNMKHARLPLGLDVIVKAHGVDYPATIFKHDSRHPHSCVVHYKEKRGGIDYSSVPIKWCKPVKRVKVRPWYREV